MSTRNFSFGRTPSLQHVAVLIGHDVTSTADNIRKLKRSRPRYRLDAARTLIASILSGQSFEWAYRQANTIKDEALKQSTKEILDCLKLYLTSIKVQWFRPITTLPYPIGRGLAIPINPTGIISDGEKIRLLWPQIWKTLTLNPMQFNIFGSVIERRVFAIEPEITELEWLEMSAPAGAQERELRLRNRDAYSPLTNEELGLVLDRLAEAVEIVNGEAPEPDSRRPRRDRWTGDLFGDDRARP